MPKRVVPWALLLFLFVVGVFLGNRLGELLAGQVAWLGRPYALEIGPLQGSAFDVIRAQLGLSLRVSPAGALLGVLLVLLGRGRSGR